MTELADAVRAASDAVARQRAKQSLLNSGAGGQRELRLVAFPDQLSVADAAILFRGLARWRPDDGGGHAVLASERDKMDATQEFLAYFNISDPASYDPTRLWGKAVGRDRLRVPLGRAAGEVFYLDFKQDAEGGWGSHGSMTSTTGGGKSEALRSLVLVLCLQHSPDEVQFVLGDFKGAATFSVLEGMPHVHGCVSNLEESADLLDRFVEAVMGELNYRQATLKDHGIDNALAWNIKRNKDIARHGESELEPMPALFTIIDEFGEATRVRPDLIELFESYNRVGRALWCHALYANQHAESGRHEKIEANLGYRLAGKVTNSQRSREAIGSGVPGSERAFTDLRNAPAGTFLCAANGELSGPFHFWYTSAPYLPPSKRTAIAAADIPEQPVEPHRFGPEVAPLPAPDSASAAISAAGEADDGEEVDDDDIDHPPTAKVLSDQIGRARPKRFHRPLWCPPLADMPAVGIDELLHKHSGQPWEPSPDVDGGLVVPLALVDEPYRAAQWPQLLDLAGSGGNVAIVGGPQAGKSTALLTLITALAMTHSPERVQIYAIDLGGGLLPALSSLPHVGMVTTTDANRQRRIMETVTNVIETRSRAFEAATYGTDSSFTISDYRARKFGNAPGDYPDDGFGDVFLVVDHLTGLRHEDEDLHGQMVTLADKGLAYGVHVVYTNDKWSTVNHQLSSKTASRIELRLLETSESQMRPRAATRPESYTVPDQPGRGLLTGGLHTLVAVPHPVDTELASHVGAIARQWAQHTPAFQPRILPESISVAALQQVPGQVPIGTGEQHQTVALDLEASNHLVVVGDGESGKTTALVTIANAVRDTYTDAAIFVVDSQRDMAKSDRELRVNGYFTDHADIRSLFRQIAQRLAEQHSSLAGDARTRARETFTGRKTFVIIDDLNIHTSGSQSENPLAPLLDYIPTARDLGLHLIVAHPISSWITAKNQPTIRKLELGSTGVLILDGDPQEGKILYGHKPSRQPVPGRGRLAYRRHNEFVQIAR